MKKVLAFVFVVVLALSCFSGAMAREFAIIGTGGVTGVYYVVGGAIGRIVGQAEENTINLIVSTQSTGGSVYNVNAIMSGDLQFGVVQSDRQYQAYNGLADWEGDPQEDLRAVFSIHAENVVLVAAEDSGIQTMADLVGKVVSLSNYGSGSRQNAVDALTAYGIDPDTDITAQDLKAAEAAGALQDGKIDAFFYTVGHPNGSITEATSGTRKTLFVPIDDVDELIEAYPYYAYSKIPVSFYPGSVSTEDVQTFGVMATFLTSADVSDEVVYTLVKCVFENLDEFKGLHDAFANLTPEEMVTSGISIPLHDGAIQYYEEIGLDYAGK